MENLKDINMQKKHNQRLVLTPEQTDLLESVFNGNNTIELDTSYHVKVGTFDYITQNVSKMINRKIVYRPIFKFSQYYKDKIRKGEV